MKVRSTVSIAYLMNDPIITNNTFISTACIAVSGWCSNPCRIFLTTKNIHITIPIRYFAHDLFRESIFTNQKGIKIFTISHRLHLGGTYMKLQQIT